MIWSLPRFCPRRRFLPATPSLPVLDPGRGRTKKGFLWAYAVDDRPWCGPTNPAMAYIYAENCKNMRPAAHLAKFTGVLQVDGYDGFKRLASERVDQSVRLAFCWAHNLELVFMWSGGPTPSYWPETTAGGTPDKFGSIRVTGGTREDRASAARVSPGRARFRHAPRTSRAHRASFAGSW